MNNRFENRKYKLISMDLLQENEISSIPILEGCIGGESIPSNCILNICKNTIYDIIYNNEKKESILKA